VIGVKKILLKYKILAAVLCGIMFAISGNAVAFSPPPDTPIINTAIAKYNDANGNPRSPVSTTVHTLISGAPVLVVDKIASSKVVSMGSTFTYTLNVTNTGNISVSDITLVDYLSKHIVFVSASPEGMYHTGPPEGGFIEWNIPILLPGQTQTFTITARVKTTSEYNAGDPETIGNGTIINNTAIASSASTTASTTLQITVGQNPNLEISQSVSSTVSSPGDTLTYVIEYKNTGNSTATGVFITNPLPALTGVIPGTITNNGTIINNSIVWYIGDLQPQQQGSVSFSVTISPVAEYGSIITNNVSISSNQQGSIFAIPVSTLIAEGAASISITKNASSSTIIAGNNITYTIELENSGACPLTGVVVKDLLPEGTNFVSADSGGINIDGQVIWNTGTLDISESKILTLVVSTNPSLNTQTLNNTAVVECSQLSPVTALSTITVNARTPGILTFLDENWSPKYSYKQGETLRIQVSDPDRNQDSILVETVVVILTNSITKDSETIVLTETGANTGIFRTSIPTDTGPGIHNNGILSVASDSEVTATYSDPLDTIPVITKVAYIDPYGIVFNSVTGTPLQGVIVTLIDAGTGQPAILPYDPNPAPATSSNGKYAFALVPAGTYYLKLTNLPSGYSFPSVVPDHMLPAGYNVQTGSRGEHFILVSGMEPVNIDIPVDPPAGNLIVEKTVNKNTASIGDIVKYTIKITNNGGAPVINVNICDTLPHGISYVKGSSTIDGSRLNDPEYQANRTIVWSIPIVAAGTTIELSYVAIIDIDSQKGDGKNTVFATGTSLGNQTVSNTVSATIKISQAVFTSKGTIIGKVFVDRNNNAIQDPDEEGLEGVEIYMEDGTMVITDKEGKYSIPLVEPGIHVLRINESTLPAGVETVPLNNKFSGTGSSQFVDVIKHGLSKANFAVRYKDRDEEIYTIQIASYTRTGFTRAKELIEQLKDTGIEDIRLEKINDIFTVRAGVYKTKQEAEQTLEKLKKTLPDSFVKKAYYIEERIVQHQTGVSDKTQQASEKPIEWEEKIKELNNTLEFLNPQDGTIIQANQTKVLLKAPMDTKISLLVNGSEIGDKQIGRKIQYEAGNIAIYEFVGVKLARGEQNTLVANIMDDFGNIRQTQTITINVTGHAGKILVLPAKQTAYADGRSEIPVEINILDKNDNIIAYSGAITVEVNGADIKEPDADKLTSGIQIPVSEGRAIFTVKAPYQPVNAEIKVYADDILGTAIISFLPYLQNMFFVGIGELKIGSGNKKGSHYFDDKNFDDGLYSSGKAALFLKGKIFNDMLLTASYDTGKTKNQDFFRESRQNTENDERYTVYGDESKINYQALSTDKLYLRIDKGLSHAMYGDFKTNLKDAELAAYHRTFTGFSGDIQSGKFKIQSFVSHSSRIQFVDTIRGKGISGYYYLSHVPVIEGSQKIAIETRDRFRPDRVLKRETLIQGYDYWIDYDTGAVLFKSPIPSMDADFNPVYIIAIYENETSGKKYYIYGGRISVKPVEQFEIGVTDITEEKGVKNYHLTGIDATLNMPLNTTLKLEWAQSQSLFDIDHSLTPKTAEAFLFRIKSSPLKNITLSAYYKKAGDYFDNISATDVMRGTEKYGADIRYTDGKNFSVFGKYFNEKDTLNNGKYEHVSAGIEKKYEKTKFLIEAYYENSDNQYISQSSPDSRYPFDISQDLPDQAAGFRLVFEKKLTPDLSLTVEYKNNLIATAGNMGQLGIEYQIDKNRKAYVREQFANLEGRSESYTVAGVEKQITQNTVAFNEYRIVNGMDGNAAQQSIGFRNSFMLGQNITGNISLENLHTVSGAERKDQPDAFATSLGFEYLPKDEVKITTRFEYRNAKHDISHLAEFGVAYKLNPDYTLLFRERLFFNDLETGSKLTHRTIFGIAYRPISHDKFNMLGRIELKNDRDTTSTPGYDTDAYIVSVEGIYQINRFTAITGKYAGKLAKDFGVSNYTDLVSARLTKDIGSRFDMGIEYRVLCNHKTDTLLQGGSIEFGYNWFKNVWLSIGYCFDKFDTDLTGDSYSGSGPFIRLRIKLDETSFKKSRAR